MTYLTNKSFPLAKIPSRPRLSVRSSASETNKAITRGILPTTQSKLKSSVCFGDFATNVAISFSQKSVEWNVLTMNVTLSPFWSVLKEVVIKDGVTSLILINGVSIQVTWTPRACAWDSEECIKVKPYSYSDLPKKQSERVQAFLLALLWFQAIFGPDFISQKLIKDWNWLDPRSLLTLTIASSRFKSTWKTSTQPISGHLDFTLDQQRYVLPK